MSFGFSKRFVMSAFVALSMAACGGPETPEAQEEAVAQEAAPGEGQVSALDICSNTDNLTHCETVTCQSAGLYRNYNATADDFSDQFATVYYGYQLNVRNAPYRRYGPRGVRIFYQGTWGFVSANCVSGGF